MAIAGGCLVFLIAIAVVAVLWAIWRYNNLISLKNQVVNAWKQIDVQLKRRHDLIPNLIASVNAVFQAELADAAPPEHAPLDQTPAVVAVAHPRRSVP